MRKRNPAMAFAIFGSLVLASCISSKFIVKQESAAVKDGITKTESLFIAFHPIDMNEDDRKAFRTMLNLVDQGLKAKGIACTIFVEEGIDLNGDALQKAIADSGAADILSIKVAQAWRRSDSPWLDKVRLEAVLETKGSGRKLWKSSVDFKHEWSGWGSFGEKGAREIANYYLMEFAQAGFI